MELSSFSSMSLFSLHLLLVLKVLLIFYNWTMWAQLQWLHRAGLRLWSTADLFKHWYFWQNCFWTAASSRCRVVRKGGVCGDPKQELHKSRESGMPNPADGRSCQSWGKDACTFPSQILPLILALYGEVLHLAELCARHLRNQTPTGGKLLGILVYQGYPAILEAEPFWPVLLHGTSKKSSWPAEFLGASWILELSLW